MNISSFGEFIVSVPICCETDCLTGVWRLFQETGAEQLVVVDERQIPLGILRLSRFVNRLSAQDWVANLYGLGSLTAHRELLEPVIIIWEESDPAQLQSHLVGKVERQIVLVNATGEYVGLLDRLQTLRHLVLTASTQSIAQSLHQPQDQPQAVPHSQADFDQSISNSSITEVSEALTTEALTTEASTTGASTTGASTASLPESGLAFPDPLVDLLERIPLPLMLQTSAGRVITQNLAWRQQVGAIQHPQRIRRAAARILEATLACKTSAKPHQAPSIDASTDYPKVNLPVSTLELQEQSLSPTTQPVAQAEVCQFGTEPNACICVCPMKNGQDRVWQFIKIPMGSSAASQGSISQEATWSITQSLEDAGMPSFKLASLKFSPAPDWRSLIQTETLWLVLAQDMTEQQQVAKELSARNSDLIQLNRLKDEFLACISHELKTPLTAVLGMSSLLKDHLLGDLNQRQSHYAQLIYRSGRHLIAIVNNILDLTRTETGQLELLLEQVYLPTLCQQVYEQARQVEIDAGTTEADADLRFHFTIEPGVEYLVADELRLRQMLTNLLSNAVKFTEPGGEIGLQVEAWEGWVAFTVWDTGIGIPADKQHLIFQKFQQLEHPLTRQFHGTGLGLVLTQRLARLHGGDITFTSTPSQGSQFTLLLPPLPPQATEDDFELSQPRKSNAPNNRNRLVLLVEADADYLEERVEQVTELGYRAVIARSGTEAIEKARCLQPAAILLNPVLPLLSGWDVLTLLKADNSTRNIPIVLTAVRVDRERAYQNGADGFLSLPVEMAGLKRCIERLIDPSESESLNAIADLTVLHLYEGSPSFTLVAASSHLPPSQASLPQPQTHHCRVLEVDDLAQADLLARVWKPDVVLIDRIQTDPQMFVQQLSEATFLADLPLVTLTAELTHAANQVAGLSVFPYLAVIKASEQEGLLNPNMAELMQVMQLAAGMTWVPQILVMDCAAVGLSRAPATLIRPPVRTLVQYLQTAGFQSTLSNDWEKVQQKLQHQNIDLLLICVSATESPAVVSKMVQTLQQLPKRPMILVWNYQMHPAVTPAPEANFAQWSAVATQILPASLSISELLTQVNQTLTDHRRQFARELSS